MSGTAEAASVGQTLASLPVTEESVEPGALGREVAFRFETRPELHGLLILEGAVLRGMVSREQFQQRLSRRFGIELAYLRPILSVFDGAFDMKRQRMLALAEETPVAEAVRLSLARPAPLVYEPVIVLRPGGRPGLLRFHDLLLAQGRVLEEAMREANRQRELADAANEAKSRFLANISHELRTPLTAILGYSDLLREDLEGGGEAETLRRVKNIHQAGSHLLSLINNLLDLAKIESGRMTVFLEEFDVGEMLAEVETALRPLAEARGNTLRVAGAAGAGRMFSDATKVRQNLLNLGGNACKFTESGEVALEVERREGGWLEFRVRDTGIGLTAEQMARLFNPFTQGDASTTRRYGGTGLGLALVKQFSAMLGGTVGVESEMGRGSTFTMRLPARAQPAAGADSGG